MLFLHAHLNFAANASTKASGAIHGTGRVFHPGIQTDYNDNMFLHQGVFHVLCENGQCCRCNCHFYQLQVAIKHNLPLPANDYLLLNYFEKIFPWNHKGNLKVDTRMEDPDY